MRPDELNEFSHDEPGYKPQVDYQTWRVALLNATPMYLPDGVRYYDRHMETAEAFILLAGSCAILTAGSGQKPEDTVCTWLEAGKIYEVPPNVWHTLLMFPGGKLAVIENSDTCVDNSPRYYFPPEERTKLIPEIKIPVK